MGCGAGKGAQPRVLCYVPLTVCLAWEFLGATELLPGLTFQNQGIWLGNLF
jgi:hypothetical protein